MEPSGDANRVRAAMAEHDIERARDLLARYRVTLIEDVGERIVDRILDDPGFWPFIREATAHVDADEAVHAAARHLQQSPDADVQAAFTAALAWARTAE